MTGFGPKLNILARTKSPSEFIKNGWPLPPHADSLHTRTTACLQEPSSAKVTPTRLSPHVSPPRIAHIFSACGASTNPCLLLQDPTMILRPTRQHFHCAPPQQTDIVSSSWPLPSGFPGLAARAHCSRFLSQFDSPPLDGSGTALSSSSPFSFLSHTCAVKLCTCLQALVSKPATHFS